MAIINIKWNNLGYSHHSQTQVESVGNYGLKVLQYIGLKIWNILPSDIRNFKSLREFSKKVKSWVPRKCSCKICENYIYQVGFTNIHGS